MLERGLQKAAHRLESAGEAEPRQTSPTARNLLRLRITKTPHGQGYVGTNGNAGGKLPAGKIAVRSLDRSFSDAS